MVPVNFNGPELEKPRVLRICFQKVGMLRYISHLDLVRTMTKAIARVHLPIRYTCGFHPIPHLIFSAPLPVGAESPREFLDVAVLRELDPATVISVLNQELPRELAVQDVYFAETKLQAVASAEYLLTIHTPTASLEVAAYCGDILSQKPLTVRKKTKAGEKDVDVSAALLSVDASYDGVNGDVLLRLRLRADSGSFLNPDYLIKYLSAQTGLLSGSPLEEWYAVTRTHMFDADGKDFS